jgi:hypothetical protein
MVQGQPRQKARAYLKNTQHTQIKRAGRLTEVVENQHSKHEALSSNHSTTKKKKKKRKNIQKVKSAP